MSDFSDTSSSLDDDVPAARPAAPRVGCSVKAAISRVLDFLLAPVFSPHDTLEERNRKKLAIPCCILGIGNQAYLYREFEWTAAQATAFARVAVLVLAMTYVVATKKLPLALIEVVVIWAGVIIPLADDILNDGRFERWTTIICSMDLLMLTGTHSSITMTVACLTVFFLAVKTVDEGMDVGIFPAAPQEVTNATWTRIVLFQREGVFLADFYLTRMFHYGMRQGEIKARDRANLAQDVARALVKFDLETAERLVGNTDDPLHDALRGLLNNLRLYRPYVPDALFTSASTDGTESERSSNCVLAQTTNPLAFPFRKKKKRYPPRLDAPADHQSHATIVFTDVQSSTDLWEKHTGAMREAMDLHNDIMRKTVHTHRGYEVKTIGDAFMVSFDTPVGGLEFSASVQEAFVEAKWPDDILTHPLCKPVGPSNCRQWRGLRIRIGIHTGHVRLEVNPTTGRFDYMGPTVNKASRVESAAVGGAIAFTEEVFDAVAHTLGEPGAPIVTSMGPYELKGVGLVSLYACFPRSLEARVQDAQRAMADKAASAPAVSPQHLPVVKQHSSPAPRVDMLDRSGAFAGGGGGGYTIKNVLNASTGTVVHMSVDHSCLLDVPSAVSAAAELVSFTLDGVERTEGLVNGICGSYVLLGWNAGRSCGQHVVQGAKFVSHVYQCVRDTVWAQSVSTGMATGKVLHGTLGNAKHRFVTCLGAPIELSHALSLGAHHLSTFCLLAGSPSAATDTTTQIHTRPVHAWQLPRGVTLVYELNLKTYSQVQGVWALFDGSIGEEWSEKYKEAFGRRDMEFVEKLSRDDKVLQRVLLLMSGASELPQPASIGLEVPQVFDETWLHSHSLRRLAAP
ncbi:hypothetical protein DIPPA_22159 [Diplonema papillatum]|nr:hypothetical protein DIPPA_22159 [Diplonema papillatum]